MYAPLEKKGNLFFQPKPTPRKKRVTKLSNVTSQLKAFHIGKSSIHNNGVIADKSFKKGELIGNSAELKANQTVSITKDFGRFINHQPAKKANTVSEEIGKKLLIKASKSIDSGQEITSDYNETPNYIENSKSHYKK